MNLPEPVGWCHLQYNKDGTSFADCLQHYPDAYADMPLFTEAQLREALASHEAVMRQALDALWTSAGPKTEAAIKALQDALK